jgi:hypothetical protein
LIYFRIEPIWPWVHDGYNYLYVINIPWGGRGGGIGEKKFQVLPILMIDFERFKCFEFMNYFNPYC